MGGANGYWTKAESAEWLGFSIKTLDRKLKEGSAAMIRVLRNGNRVFLKAKDVEAYFKLSEERGFL